MNFFRSKGSRERIKQIRGIGIDRGFTSEPAGNSFQVQPGATCRGFEDLRGMGMNLKTRDSAFPARLIRSFEDQEDHFPGAFGTGDEAFEDEGAVLEHADGPQGSPGRAESMG